VPPLQPQPDAAQAAFDVLIVGSGLAGLGLALHLPASLRIGVLTKNVLGEGASRLAQGGMAAVLGPGDDAESHLQDTLRAGAGLCDLHAARTLVAHAPQVVHWLQSLGVPFTREQGALHLTREGGHGRRRVVHVDDATGAAVQAALVARCRAAQHVTLFEQHTLVDLTPVPAATRCAHDPDRGARRCTGVQVLDERSCELRTLRAPVTVLATGGLGQVYGHTTNPLSATGDGVAAAWRAGCSVQNLEFIQFHPTALVHAQAPAFLLSEALRGEGALLRRPDGTRFMPQYDARAELAPRDVVARAIAAEMQRHALDCVHLDITHQDSAFVRMHFPSIAARCAELGLDITRQPIPVAPAAHYSCGGVRTSPQGQTDLPGLYALGETACTGLHGANRLASNSLTECLVQARAAAQHIVLALAAPRVQPAPAPVASAPADPCRAVRGQAETARVAHSARAAPLPMADAEAAADALGECDDADPAQALRARVQQCMRAGAGIVRSAAGLADAARELALVRTQAQAALAAQPPRRAALELRNLLQVAELIVRAAQQREESRGLHFRSDFPQLHARAQASLLPGAGAAADALAANGAAPAAASGRG